jgi:hypothetical protein
MFKLGAASRTGNYRPEKDRRPVQFEIAKQTRTALEIGYPRPRNEGAVSISGPFPSAATPLDSAICWIIHAWLDAPNKAAQIQSASGSASARTHEAGEHGARSGIEVDDALSVAEQIDL